MMKKRSQSLVLPQQQQQQQQGGGALRALGGGGSSSFATTATTTTFERTVPETLHEDLREHQRLAQDLQASKFQVNALFGGGSLGVDHPTSSHQNQRRQRAATTATTTTSGSNGSGGGGGGAAAGAMAGMTTNTQQPQEQQQQQQDVHEGAEGVGGVGVSSPPDSRTNRSQSLGGLEESPNHFADLPSTPTSSSGGRGGVTPLPSSSVAGVGGGGGGGVTSSALAQNTYVAPGHSSHLLGGSSSTHILPQTLILAGADESPEGAQPSSFQQSSALQGLGSPLYHGRTPSGGGNFSGHFTTTGSGGQQQLQAIPISSSGGGGGSGTRIRRLDSTASLAESTSSSIADSSDGDIWMEQYRRERLDEIMRRANAGGAGGLGMSGSGGNGGSGGGGIATPGGGGHSPYSSGVFESSEEFSNMMMMGGSTTPGGQLGSNRSFSESGGLDVSPSPLAGSSGHYPPATPSGSGGHTPQGLPLPGQYPESGGYRRRSSSTGSHWAQPTGRLALSIDELDLCKRVDLELKRLVAAGGGSTSGTTPHLERLDKQTIIRAVQCKKTFDRSVEMCKNLGSAIIDRFGLGQLTKEDVRVILSRQALLRIEPSVCVSRHDGSSFFYLVVTRLMQPSMPPYVQLVQALLYLIEKHRAFEGRLTVIVDLSNFELTPGNAKDVTQLSEVVFKTLVDKYPCRVSRILLFNPKGFGMGATIMVKGILMKVLNSKWRDRTRTVKSLDEYVQNRAALRRELFEKLNW